MADYRELKNRTRISTTLDNDIFKMLKEYTVKTQVPMSKIMDMAISQYIKKMDK